MLGLPLPFAIGVSLQKVIPAAARSAERPDVKNHAHDGEHAEGEHWHKDWCAAKSDFRLRSPS
jgi:hypothetical protein